MVSQDNDILSSNRSLIVSLIGSGFMTIMSLGTVYMLKRVVWPVANRQHFGSITSLLSAAALISQQLALLRFFLASLWGFCLNFLSLPYFNINYYNLKYLSWTAWHYFIAK